MCQYVQRHVFTHIQCGFETYCGYHVCLRIRLLQITAPSLRRMLLFHGKRDVPISSCCSFSLYPSIPFPSDEWRTTNRSPQQPQVWGEAQGLLMKGGQSRVGSQLAVGPVAGHLGAPLTPALSKNKKERGQWLSPPCLWVSWGSG